MKAALIVAMILMPAAPLAAQSWTGIGPSDTGAGISIAPGTGAAPVMDLDASDCPIVAWLNESPAARDVYLLKWNPAALAWVELGGSARERGISGTGTAGDPQLVIHGSGVFVAWTNTAPNGAKDIYLKQWDGISWTAIGNSAEGGGISKSGKASEPSLAADLNGVPFVAWTQGAGGVTDIHVRTWNGTIWADAADPAVPGGISHTGKASQPSIAMRWGTDPAVAWVDRTSGEPEIYYQARVLSAWSELLGSASAGGVSASGHASDPVLMFASTDPTATQAWPVIAWTDDASGIPQICMKQPVSKAGVAGWSGLGDSAPGGLSHSLRGASRPSVDVTLSGGTVVGWEELLSDGTRVIYYRQWNGAEWIQLWGSSLGGGVSGTGADASHPSVRIDRRLNPIVAWAHQTPAGSEIYVRRLDSGLWVGLGGSGAGSGVSENPGDSTAASMALTTDGRPVVAWLDTSSGQYQVYLKKWTGSAWVELVDAETGFSSASGRGVSNQPPSYASYTTENPVVCVDGAGHPVVAWQGWAPTSPGSTDMRWFIFVTRWDGTRWIPLFNPESRSAGINQDLGLYWAATVPSMTLDAVGNPIVAWQQQTEYYNIKSEIYVRRWDGTRWTEFGSSAAGGGVSATASQMSLLPSIRVDSAGRPVVAWVERVGTGANIRHRLYLKRWDGSAWSELVDSGSGAGSASGRGVMDRPQGAVDTVVLCLDATGNPVVAWEEGSHVNLLAWNGEGWSEVGGSASGSGVSAGVAASYPSLALDDSGFPVLAWGDHNSSEIHVRRWNGTAWENEGIEDLGITAGIRPSLALDGGCPVVAFQNRPLVGDPPQPGPNHVYLMQRPNWEPLIAAPSQFRLDGTTPIPQGGLTVEEEGVVVTASVFDPNRQRVSLEIEIQETGVPFADDSLPGWQATAVSGLRSGDSTITVSCPLAINRRYHWRARARDSQGKACGWISHGTNPDDLAETDFRLRTNAAPGFAEMAGQRHPGTGAMIARGAALADTFRVEFTATPTDADGDAVRLEVECRLAGQAFTGSPTAVSSQVSRGPASVIQELEPGSYRWQCRIVDGFGKPSGWIAFGDGMSADFSLEGGSFGKTFCSSAALGPAGELRMSLLILAFVLAAFGRRRAS